MFRRHMKLLILCKTLRLPLRARPSFVRYGLDQLQITFSIMLTHCRMLLPNRKSGISSHPHKHLPPCLLLLLFVLLLPSPWKIANFRRQNANRSTLPSLFPPLLPLASASSLHRAPAVCLAWNWHNAPSRHLLMLHATHTSVRFIRPGHDTKQFRSFPRTLQCSFHSFNSLSSRIIPSLSSYTILSLMHSTRLLSTSLRLLQVHMFVSHLIPSFNLQMPAPHSLLNLFGTRIPSCVTWFLVLSTSFDLPLYL